jgi:hypothetical protein
MWMLRAMVLVIVCWVALVLASTVVAVFNGACLSEGPQRGKGGVVCQLG